MITPTEYKISKELLSRAQTEFLDIDFKLCINQPTGDFFYDPWILKPEFKNTVWEELLKSLPVQVGEARLIKLAPATSYHAHADMDDRYHLNIQSNRSYLIDLDCNIMHPIESDGIWYDMNAGLIHTAANFSNVDRVQLVVRKLLLPNNLVDPVSVKIVVKEGVTSYRYTFDSKISPWLNAANKIGILNNFVYRNEQVSFNIERNRLTELKSVVPDIFEIYETVY
jgi:hypothetical protein